MSVDKPVLDLKTIRDVLQLPKFMPDDKVVQCASLALQGVRLALEYAERKYADSLSRKEFLGEMLEIPLLGRYFHSFYEREEERSDDWCYIVEQLKFID